jgi:hypothetical protein
MKVEVMICKDKVEGLTELYKHLEPLNMGSCHGKSFHHGGAQLNS